jgi:hypothetical protein
VIRALIRYVSKHDFTAFAYYRIGFGFLFWRHGGQVGCIGNADDMLVSAEYEQQFQQLQTRLAELDVSLQGKSLKR